MGQWDDKHKKHEMNYDSWRMYDYAQEDRVLHKIIEDKAKKNPYHVVFQFKDTPITLEQLNANINRAANGFAALGVKHIVVCGHTDCGAMKGALNPAGLDGLPHVQEWLDHSRAAADIVKAKHGQVTVNELGEVTEQNVLLQMQHLRTHPAVASPLSTGEADLHGWVYDIEHGTVNAYCEEKKAFIPAEERYASMIADANFPPDLKTA